MLDTREPVLRNGFEVTFIAEGTLSPHISERTDLHRLVNEGYGLGLEDPSRILDAVEREYLSHQLGRINLIGLVNGAAVSSLSMIPWLDIGEIGVQHGQRFFTRLVEHFPELLRIRQLLHNMPLAFMVDGLVTLPDFRGRGYAKGLISALWDIYHPLFVVSQTRSPLAAACLTRGFITNEYYTFLGGIPIPGRDGQVLDQEVIQIITGAFQHALEIRSEDIYSQEDYRAHAVPKELVKDTDSTPNVASIPDVIKSVMTAIFAFQMQRDIISESDIVVAPFIAVHKKVVEQINP